MKKYEIENYDKTSKTGAGAGAVAELSKVSPLKVTMKYERINIFRTPAGEYILQKSPPKPESKSCNTQPRTAWFL